MPLLCCPVHLTVLINDNKEMSGVVANSKNTKLSRHTTKQITDEQIINIIWHFRCEL